MKNNRSSIGAALGILTMSGIGIAMLQMNVKDTSMLMAILGGGTVIFAIITFVLYKMGVGKK